jgi:MoaA/NifB/PqqE/SkfB family radical SAM enzyme
MNTPELSLEENKQILKKLLALKPTKISFVGGEPLLYGDKLFDLISFGKQVYNKTEYSLTTNAILLFDDSLNLNVDLLDKITKNFDWLTFSLDGCDEIIQSKMTRNINHFHRISILLARLNKTYKNIKINTLISKINISGDNIHRIANMLIEFNIKRWKLMRFLPSRGSAYKNKDTFAITDSQFQEVYNKVMDYVSGRIEISKNNKFDFCNYFNVSSDGKLINYDGREYHEEIDVFNANIDSLRLSFEKIRKYEEQANGNI